MLGIATYSGRKSFILDLFGQVYFCFIAIFVAILRTILAALLPIFVVICWPKNVERSLRDEWCLAKCPLYLYGVIIWSVVLDFNHLCLMLLSMTFEFKKRTMENILRHEVPFFVLF